MDAALINGLQIVASFAGMMVALIIALNWLMRGMIFAFIKVRASRGKKTMVDIHGVNEVYYKVGQFDGSAFAFKNRAGKECLIAQIPADCVHNTMGIQKIEYDEVNKCIWTRAGAIIQGNDPVAVDGMIKRALESPEAKDKMMKVVLVLLILTFIMCGISLAISVNVLLTLGKTTLATIIS